MSCTRLSPEMVAEPGYPYERRYQHLKMSYTTTTAQLPHTSHERKLNESD